MSRVVLITDSGCAFEYVFTNEDKIVFNGDGSSETQGNVKINTRLNYEVPDRFKKSLMED